MSDTPDDTLPDLRAEWQEYARNHHAEVDELRAIVRAVIGPCPHVNIQPGGPLYIEATCHWHDRNAYVLLCRQTHNILRFNDAPIAPLMKRDKPKRRQKPAAPLYDTTGREYPRPFSYIKENENE
jgi:hypothetical protein